MPRAIKIIILLQYRRCFFFPAFRVFWIFRSVHDQKPQTVFISPGATGGICQIHRIPTNDNRRALVDQWISMQFKIIFGHGKHDFLVHHFGRADHFRKIQILAHILISFPAGPDKISLSIQLQNGSIDRKFIVHPSDRLKRPFSLQRIFSRIGQDIHEMHFLSRSHGSKINIPHSIQIPDFRRPKIPQLRSRIIDRLHLYKADSGNGVRICQTNIAACCFRIKITLPIAHNIWIGSLHIDDRADHSCGVFYVCFHIRLHFRFCPGFFCHFGCPCR